MKWKEMNQWIKNEIFYSWKLKYLPQSKYFIDSSIKLLKNKIYLKRILKKFPTSQKKNLKK